MISGGIGELCSSIKKKNVRGLGDSAPQFQMKILGDVGGFCPPKSNEFFNI
jgi:hypothetical protein